MQVKSFLVAGLLSTIVFVSCNKKSDDVSAPPPPSTTVSIEGNWVGKYSVLSGPYNNHYSFNIKAGGLLEELNISGQKTGEGTWVFHNNNTIITGSYTLLPPATGSFSFIANFDKVTGKLDGTWGTGPKEYGGGYWFMNKTK